MNPDFKKLVDLQVSVAKKYGKDSPENKAALETAQRWQEACQHDFTKRSKAGLMCANCNYPKKP